MGKTRYISKLIKDCKTSTTNNISLQKPFKNLSRARTAATIYLRLRFQEHQW